MVDTTGRMFKDGAWVDAWHPKLWIFLDGDNPYGLKRHTDMAILPTYNNQPINIGNTITMVGYFQNANDWRGSQIITQQMIDVTQYKKAYVSYVGYTSNTPYGKISFGFGYPEHANTALNNAPENKTWVFYWYDSHKYVYESATPPPNPISLDITSLSGNAYFQLSATAVNGQLTIAIDKIWLE